MRGRTWTLMAGIASVAALVAVPSALGAYTAVKLEVRQTGTTTAIKVSGNPDEDSTAAVRIFAPAGTQLTTNQAPGTVLGQVKASVKALDLAGADLPLEGQLVVAGPGQVSPASQAACLQGARPLAVWVIALTAAGQSLQLPLFLVATSGAQTALGPGYIQACLQPPDLPPGTPGRMPFGAKLYGLEGTISGVFSPVPLGAWIAFWTPYTPGVGSVNVAGTVATPAAIAPGAVTLAAKTAGKGAVVTGTVTQAGQPRSGASVTITGGATKAKLTTTKKVRVGATGKFAAKFAVGTFFRATAVATAAAATPLCTQLSAALAPIPCANPTVNGFTAKSRVVKKK